MNVILFDGVCNLCTHTVSFLIKYDKNNNLKLAACQTNAGENIIRQYNLMDESESVVFIKNGIVFYKSDAIIEIAKQIKGWPHIFKYTSFLPKFLRDGMYNLIAKNRYSLFGKKVTCMLPTNENQKRFLS